MSQRGEMRDAEALRRLRADPEAIGLLYDRYVEDLVGFLQRVGADRDAAMDAAQETFARLLAGGGRVRLEENGSLWPWLSVSGRNLVRDWQRRGVVDAAARHRLGITTRVAGADSIDDAVARVDAAGFGRPLRAALEGLSADQRRAVAARVVGGQSYREIAVAADTSEQTIRGRVSRGLRSMHAFLEGGRQ